MKKLLSLVLLILIGCSEPEPLNYELLEERDGVHYRKDTNKIYSGPVINLWKNGQIQGEGTMKEDGPWKSYFENGQLQLESTNKDGKPDGPLKTYYENGQLQREGTNKDGKPDGLWKVYDINGQLRKEGTYKDGELIDVKEY